MSAVVVQSASPSSFPFDPAAIGRANALREIPSGRSAKPSPSMRSVSPKEASMSGPNADQGWSEKARSRSAMDRVWSALVDFDGIVAFWRRRYPAATAEHVAADLGAPVGTAKKWVLRAADPCGKWLLAAIAFYGPDLLASGFKQSPAWVEAARRAEQAADLDRRIADLVERRRACEDGFDSLSSPRPPFPGPARRA